MIVDHRTYWVKPGKLNEFLKLYEKDMLPIQRKHLGHCVGWYVSNDIGPLSQVIHMWAYKDLADRDARRAKMQQDPGPPVIWKRRCRCSTAWRTRSCALRLTSPSRS